MPSDNKMTAEQQDRIIKVIKALHLNKEVFRRDYEERKNHKLYRKMGFYERYIKERLILFCSGLAIIVFCWLYAIIALLVRIKLGSPVLFTQYRPGLIDPKTGKERIFKMYKFFTIFTYYPYNAIYGK